MYIPRKVYIAHSVVHISEYVIKGLYVKDSVSVLEVSVSGCKELHPVLADSGVVASRQVFFPAVLRRYYGSQHGHSRSTRGRREGFGYDVALVYNLHVGSGSVVHAAVLIHGEGVLYIVREFLAYPAILSGHHRYASCY